jgi:hypothetical protein
MAIDRDTGNFGSIHSSCEWNQIVFKDLDFVVVDWGWIVLLRSQLAYFRFCPFSEILKSKEMTPMYHSSPST